MSLKLIFNMERDGYYINVLCSHCEKGITDVSDGVVAHFHEGHEGAFFHKKCLLESLEQQGNMRLYDGRLLPELIADLRNNGFHYPPWFVELSDELRNLRTLGLDPIDGRECSICRDWVQLEKVLVCLDLDSRETYPDMLAVWCCPDCAKVLKFCGKPPKHPRRGICVPEWELCQANADGLAAENEKQKPKTDDSTDEYTKALTTSIEKTADSNARRPPGKRDLHRRTRGSTQFVN
jgi:hypothetical protein